MYLYLNNYIASMDKFRFRNRFTSGKEIERQLEEIPLQSLYNILSSKDVKFKEIDSKIR